MNVESALSSPGLRVAGSGVRNAASPLSRILRSASQKPTPDRHEQLVHAARQLVSQTFFGQMLKQMRDDPFKSKLFDGGRGGEMFSAMYDQKLAERMARGAGNKLVMSVVRHIEKGAARHKGRPAASSGKSGLGGKPSTGGDAGGAGNSFKNVRIHVAADLRA